MKRRVRIILCIVAVVLFAWLVWPTPFRYANVQIKQTHLYIRINRFTGNAEMLIGTGWRPMEKPEPNPFEGIANQPPPPQPSTQPNSSDVIKKYGGQEINPSQSNQPDPFAPYGGHMTSPPSK